MRRDPRPMPTRWSADPDAQPRRCSGGRRSPGAGRRAPCGQRALRARPDGRLPGGPRRWVRDDPPSDAPEGGCPDRRAAGHPMTHGPIVRRYPGPGPQGRHDRPTRDQPAGVGSHRGTHPAAGHPGRCGRPAPRRAGPLRLLCPAPTAAAGHCRRADHPARRRPGPGPLVGRNPGARPRAAHRPCCGPRHAGLSTRRSAGHRSGRGSLDAGPRPAAHLAMDRRSARRDSTNRHAENHGHRARFCGRRRAMTHVGPHGPRWRDRHPGLPHGTRYRTHRPVDPNHRDQARRPVHGPGRRDRLGGHRTEWLDLCPHPRFRPAHRHPGRPTTRPACGQANHCRRCPSHRGPAWHRHAGYPGTSCRAGPHLLNDPYAPGNRWGHHSPADDTKKWTPA